MIDSGRTLGTFPFDFASFDRLTVGDGRSTLTRRQQHGASLARSYAGGTCEGQTAAIRDWSTRAAGNCRIRHQLLKRRADEAANGQFLAALAPSLASHVRLVTFGGYFQTVSTSAAGH